jgi:glycerol kinase
MTDSIALALDQGTTSSRAIAFNVRGERCALAQQEFTQHFPQPGWVEHDAEEIWRTQLHVAQQAIRQVSGPVCAIGITNQRETIVVWERSSGMPVGPAIVWQDRRTASYCDELRAAGYSELVRSKTGLVIDAYFSATKIRWILDNTNGARDRANNGELACGTIDSWLIWKLTNGKVHATDASNASRTMLYDIYRNEWDRDLLRMFDIPISILPCVVANQAVVGVTACEGLPPGIPIAGVAGDQQAALFGQVCLQPGMAKNTYGTGCFMLMNVGSTINTGGDLQGLLKTTAWQRPGSASQHALEGSVFIAGAAVQWLRDGLGIIERASDIEALAASVPDSGDVAFVPALAGLGAPYWDSSARGTVVGLTRGTTRAHIARATLDAIALQSTEVLRAMCFQAKAMGVSLSELRVDGGAARNDLLMQTQADLMQIPVIRPAELETTALGAAYLAFRAIGVIESDEALSRSWSVDRRFEPRISFATAEQRLERWQEAVEKSRGWVKRDHS